ncbi:ABC transporter permease [Aeromicrobium sp. Root495]|uniref:ECF transporter S component n=1 Tax=Aeromicrobium sp. Root495 TaxID=1736550 RepID=UPI0006FF40B3|nr:ECF transporter S component [Aeromicrobium sp. Root495]KQY56085.1 ABC transporter permease [Aeromicrobium sp. Root495]RYJ07160.1 MAG: ABC transporter permease [Actinomycetales bacterium]
MSSASTTTTTDQARGLDVRYRTIDLVTIATLAVAFGVIFWGWGKAYEPLSALALFSYPPSSAVLAGPWLAAGVIGGLIVRKPGAAFATEFLAAAVSTVVIGGTQWGWTVFASGFFQGLGAELIFLLVFYRKFGVVVAMASGALAGIIEAFYEWTQFAKGWGWDYKLAHLGFLTASGIVVAGLGSWLLVKALAEAGVLDAFEPGREAAEATDRE